MPNRTKKQSKLINQKSQTHLFIDEVSIFLGLDIVMRDGKLIVVDAKGNDK